MTTRSGADALFARLAGLRDTLGERPTAASPSDVGLAMVQGLHDLISIAADMLEAQQAPQGDPLDESDHADRLDFDGDRWTWIGRAWECESPPGVWHHCKTLADVRQYAGDPITFAPPQAIR